MGYPTTEVRLEDGGDKLTIGAGGTLVFEAGATVSGGVLTVPAVGDLTTRMAAHYSIAPAAVSAVAVHAAITLGAAAADVTTAINAIDFPRNVTIKGNAGGIAGDVVITGTNVAGDEITETIALNASSEVLGTKAFASVTNIHVPAKTNGSGDTVSIGWGKVLGLPQIVYNAAFLLVKLFDGSTDSGSLTVDSDEVEKNVFALNGSPNGAKLVDLVYLV
jgi:hypothetical protein